MISEKFLLESAQNCRCGELPNTQNDVRHRELVLWGICSHLTKCRALPMNALTFEAFAIDCVHSFGKVITEQSLYYLNNKF